MPEFQNNGCLGMPQIVSDCVRGLQVAPSRPKLLILQISVLVKLKNVLFSPISCLSRQILLISGLKSSMNKLCLTSSWSFLTRQIQR